MNNLTAILISGGLDSFTAAYLLKQQGRKIVGIHFITGYETATEDDSVVPKKTRNRIARLESRLDISINIVDVSMAFQKQVVDYFTATYQAGLTPNPCMVCNRSIKFGLLRSLALQYGASQIATGHYARIEKDTSGNFHLLPARDLQKDQSYFLALLNQEQLAASIFPLGGIHKAAVRKMATQKGFLKIIEEESQDVCFIKNSSYGDFLIRYQGLKPEPGDIKDMNGNSIGQHKGLHLFTVGQRRGINCPASEPYYVVKIDKARNQLIVGSKKDLLSSECNVKNINWIIENPSKPSKIYARLRYRNKPVPALLIPQDQDKAVLKFQKPQTAVTPGQGAVFYQNREILGGGWIDKTNAI